MNSLPGIDSTLWSPTGSDGKGGIAGAGLPAAAGCVTDSG
jgi:hypothetical protein